MKTVHLKLSFFQLFIATAFYDSNTLIFQERNPFTNIFTLKIGLCSVINPGPPSSDYITLFGKKKKIVSDGMKCKSLQVLFCF